MCCENLEKWQLFRLGSRDRDAFPETYIEGKDKLELPSQKKKMAGVYFCMKRREPSKQRLGTKKAGDFLRPEEVENV